jgi:hypothetical protein
VRQSRCSLGCADQGLGDFLGASATDRPFSFRKGMIVRRERFQRRVWKFEVGFVIGRDGKSTHRGELFWLRLRIESVVTKTWSSRTSKSGSVFTKDLSTVSGLDAALIDYFGSKADAEVTDRAGAVRVDDFQVSGVPHGYSGAGADDRRSRRFCSALFWCCLASESLLTINSRLVSWPKWR